VSKLWDNFHFEVNYYSNILNIWKTMTALSRTWSRARFRILYQI